MNRRLLRFPPRRLGSQTQLTANLGLPNLLVDFFPSPGVVETPDSFGSHTFSALAGDVLRVEVKATSEDFDPAFLLVDPKGPDVFGAADGGGEGDDALSQGIEIPESDVYGLLVFTRQP